MRASRLIISFALSIVFLYLTFFIPRVGGWFAGEFGLGEALFGQMRFDLARLGSVIAACDWRPIAVAAVLFFTSQLLRAWRWEVMLAPMVRMRYWDVFGAMVIGYMANNLLPMRMGELYRAQVVHQIADISRSAAFGAVVLERVTDLLFMIPYMGLALVLFPLPGYLAKAAFVVGIIVLAITGLFLWIVFDRARALSLMERVLKLLPQKACRACMSLIEKFTSGLAVLGQSKHLWGISFSSLILWAMYGVMAYCVLDALGFTHAGIEMIDRNPVGALLVILMITTVGYVIPSAPGAVGTYHGVSVLGLTLLGVPGERAAGFAIVLHALNYIPLTVMGLIFFWRLGLSFRETSRLAEVADGAGQAAPGSSH